MASYPQVFECPDCTDSEVWLCTLWGEERNKSSEAAREPPDRASSFKRKTS